MGVYERSGRRGTPANTPRDCNQCQYTEAEATHPVLIDTDRDAFELYQYIRDGLIRSAWTNAWNSFRCPPPNRDCRTKEPCEDTPIYIEGGGRLVRGPDGFEKFQIYVIVGRRIQCTDGNRRDDVPPRIPPYRKPNRPLEK